MLYQWKLYEKISLSAASVLGWFPVAWVAYIYIIFLTYRVNGNFYIMEISLFAYIMFFGVVPFFFPKFYILPTLLLNFFFFALGVKKIIVFILLLDKSDFIFLINNLNSIDLNAISEKAGYRSYTSRDFYLPVLELVFLIVLYRPALFYVRFLWRKSKE